MPFKILMLTKTHFFPMLLGHPRLQQLASLLRVLSFVVLEIPRVGPA